MQPCLQFACCLTMMTAWASTVEVAAAARPNFVIILADDLGYGDLGPYDGWIDTPHLERMTDEGLRFTDFHSSGNVCSPTRAGLLTGRYQHRAGLASVVNADAQLPVHFAGLQSEEVTLPELLRDAGYRTALFGKWHLGYYPVYNPTRHGFDEFRGYVSGNVDYHSHLDNQNREDWWRSQQREADEGYSTHLISEYAVEFLAREHRQPFLLIVAHEAPHNPYQGPNDPPVRGPQARGNAARPVKEIYRDMVAELDRGVGQVLETLRETGQADNTLVFFFSDNGPTKAGSAGPLRGQKGSDWEGGHRVPGIAWWPGTVAPGVTDQLATSLDLMPTALELASVEVPPSRLLDGTSLAALLERGEPLGERTVYWDKAMRHGPWKLMMTGNQGELFRLDRDLSEAHNLARDEPDRLRRMQQAWSDWQRQMQADATPQPQSERDLPAPY